MGFLLHFLRPSDLFVDVGANIGTVTMLASSTVGCRTIAIEPSPSAAAWIVRNTRLNNAEQRVEVHQLAASDSDGMLFISDMVDPSNRTMNSNVGSRIAVQSARLDTLLRARAVSVVKIDTEGWETRVLGGMTELLRMATLRAVIIELRGHGNQYGHDEGEIRRKMSLSGFSEIVYDPFQRTVLTRSNAGTGEDAIFVRDPSEAQARVAAASRREIIWGQHV